MKESEQPHQQDWRSFLSTGMPQDNGVGNFVPNRAFIRYYRGHSIACGTGEQFAWGRARPIFHHAVERSVFGSDADGGRLGL